jgi:hypothetical protein
MAALMSGCLKDDGSSYTSVDVSCLAVVGYSEITDFKYLSTYSHGAVLPDDISTLDKYNPGDCAAVKFTIDTRNQIEGANYWVGSSVSVERVEQTAVEYSEQPEDTTGYSFPIDTVELHPYYTSAFNYDGRFFVYIGNLIAKTQKVEYSMQCDWSKTDENNALVLYLKGKVIGLEGEPEKTESLYAFDLNPMFDRPDVWKEYVYKDTDTGREYKCRSLEVVLKYFTENNNGEPMYNYANNSSSFTLYLYKGE